MNKWYHIDSLPIKLSGTTAIMQTSGEVVVVGGRLGQERMLMSTLDHCTELHTYMYVL